MTHNRTQNTAAPRSDSQSEMAGFFHALMSEMRGCTDTHLQEFSGFYRVMADAENVEKQPVFCGFSGFLNALFSLRKPLLYPAELRAQLELSGQLSACIEWDRPA